MAGTNRGPKIAKYHIALTPPIIRRLELGCIEVADETNESAGTEILPQLKPHVREFWREVVELDVVGASLGEETKFIYVTYQSCGIVHGRPMTKRELRQRGAEL